MESKDKEYWYITDKGDLDIDIDGNKYKDTFRKIISNYFKTVYEFDRFLSKLETKQ